MVKQGLEVEKVVMDVLLLGLCEFSTEGKFGEPYILDIVFLWTESVLKRVRERQRNLVLAGHESYCFD